MMRRCEVCVNAGEGHGVIRRGRLRRLLIESRIVALCEEHAQTVSGARVATLDELRALFPESRGQRSLVERRTPLDRRVFPARPEGRRRNAGRRSTDTE